MSNKKHDRKRQNQQRKMSELQTVSLVLLKISINDLSLGVRNRSDTVTSKICSLRPSQNMGAQRVVYQSGTPGCIPIKIF